MAVKPENTFISGVHKHLPSVKVIHREKMNNPYRGGTADWWYSGTKNDLWIEYKFLPRMPQRGDITPERIGLTALQLDWLRGRYAEGRNVGVIVGCPKGGVIMRDLAWDSECSVQAFTSQIIDRKALASWIVQQTTG